MLCFSKAVEPSLLGWGWLEDGWRGLGGRDGGRGWRAADHSMYAPHVSADTSHPSPRIERGVVSVEAGEGGPPHSWGVEFRKKWQRTALPIMRF